jgi:hypothetical protein
MFAVQTASPAPLPVVPTGDQTRALNGVIADVRRMKANAAAAGLNFARDRLTGLAEAASKLLLLGRGQITFTGVKSLMNGAISAMDTMSDAAGAATDRSQLRKMADEFDTLGTRLSAMAGFAARSDDDRKEAASFQARMRSALARLREASN